MRKFLLAATLVAFAVPLTPAMAEPQRWAQNDEAHDRNANRRDAHEQRKDDRRAERRAERRADRRADRRTYSRYDYNRPDPRYGNYSADRYYIADNQYQPRRLSAGDRIYRGQDNRYYCRRNDGTTGLIIGGLAGGLLGNTIAPGGSKMLGTILGGGAGALIGRSVDRDGSNISCR
jgi:Ni/Co efflux regulator RcnB